MFYCSSIKEDLIGVTDSKDGVEEFYLKSDLMNIISNVLKEDIMGVYIKGNELITIKKSKFKSQFEKTFAGLNLISGTPLVLKYASSVVSKLVLFAGVSAFLKEDTSEYFSCKYYFYDARAINPSFALSSDYMLRHNNEFKLSLDNLDPVEISTLLRSLDSYKAQQ